MSLVEDERDLISNASLSPLLFLFSVPAAHWDWPILAHWSALCNPLQVSTPCSNGLIRGGEAAITASHLPSLFKHSPSDFDTKDASQSIVCPLNTL